MTGRRRLEMTLQFEQPDRPPHFGSMFELGPEGAEQAMGSHITGWADASRARPPA